jgi:NAD(P)-dependent dehydrogenase (short-subunit alcohol dehydrogenase family)
LSSVAGQSTNPGASLYHATKWGIEGFTEALAAEVAAFGIGVTIIEPGRARTGFSTGSLQWGPRLDVYDVTPIPRMRALLQSSDYQAPGDPVRMAAAMIDSLNQTPAPLRLILGSDYQERIAQALKQRLAGGQARKKAISPSYR